LCFPQINTAIKDLPHLDTSHLSVPVPPLSEHAPPGLPAPAPYAGYGAPPFLAPPAPALVAGNHRADSGVGESIEGTITTTTGSQQPVGLLDEEEELELGEASAGTLRELPDPSEYRRYERKKKMGLSFLSTITPQQLSSMSPTLKASMDHFLSQLEEHGVSRGEGDEKALAVTKGQKRPLTDRHCLWISRRLRRGRRRGGRSRDDGLSLSPLLLLSRRGVKKFFRALQLATKGKVQNGPLRKLRATTIAFASLRFASVSSFGRFF